MIARQKNNIKSDRRQPGDEDEEHHDVKGPCHTFEQENRFPIWRGGNDNPNQRAEYNLTHFAQALAAARVPPVARATHFSTHFLEFKKYIKINFSHSF